MFDSLLARLLDAGERKTEAERAKELAPDAGRQAVADWELAVAALDLERAEREAGGLVLVLLRYALRHHLPAVHGFASEVVGELQWKALHLHLLTCELNAERVRRTADVWQAIEGLRRDAARLRGENWELAGEVLRLRRLIDGGGDGSAPDSAAAGGGGGRPAAGRPDPAPVG